ncbi:MAG: HD domain-containing protein [Gemmataceae bacterium]|nr:HD domain-containing protein [Gemmataceae bacterium]
MNDTRKLLNRIAEFRQRLEAMPRLVPAVGERVPEPAPQKTKPVAVEAGTRTQAILEESLRQLGGAPESSPVALSNRARRLLVDAQGLVTRLKIMADDPLLAGPPPSSQTDGADPLAVHFRETASMTEAAVRYALTMPESASEQMRLCEGLEGMIDAARRRFEMLANALERRRCENTRIDTLTRFLCNLDSGSSPLDPSPLLSLADELLNEEPGRPLRFATCGAGETQAFLGSEKFPAPARFVAMHSLNCACVAARLVQHDPEWRMQARDVVLAALLHDVGMLRIDPAFLAEEAKWDEEHRTAIKFHTRSGAERILGRLPGFSGLAGIAAGHHERADGSGYPAGLHNDQVSPLTRLIAAIDVYVAMCSARPHREPMDSRAALTDVLLMGEAGQLDRVATDKLLSLGLYPSGSIVELSDGWTALVLTARDPRSEMQKAARPQVALLADPAGRALANPRFLDLAGSNSGNVIRALSGHDRLQRLGRSYPEWA